VGEREEGEGVSLEEEGVRSPWRERHERDASQEEHDSLGDAHRHLARGTGNNTAGTPQAAHHQEAQARCSREHRRPPCTALSMRGPEGTPRLPRRMDSQENRLSRSLRKCSEDPRQNDLRRFLRESQNRVAHAPTAASRFPGTASL